MSPTSFSCHPVLTLFSTLALGAATATAAQVQADSSSFTVVRNADTVAVERFVRTETELSGTVQLRGKGERVQYHTVIAPDQTVPLVEVSAWRTDDPDRQPPRQRTRLIFKDDSVAIDDVTPTATFSLVLPTGRGALPYLNLSFAFLEQATRRALSLARDSVAVPFFSLGGGQTVVGTVRRVAPDSAVVAIGTVEFHLRVDPRGQVVGGSIPSQQVTITRAGGG